MQSIKVICSAILVAFAPIQPMIFAVIALILIDLITGIWAALKRDEKIQSACLRRTVTKTAVYQFALVSAFIVEKWLLGDSLPLVKFVTSIISLTETLSIFENLNVIYGSNIFKKVLLLLGSTNDPKNKD